MDNDGLRAKVVELKQRIQASMLATPLFVRCMNEYML